jgi:hypothetical protein
MNAQTALEEKKCKARVAKLVECVGVATPILHGFESRPGSNHKRKTPLDLNDYQ